MKRVSIALGAFCLVTSHLMAQGAVRSNAYESRPVVPGTTWGSTVGPWQNVNGGVCYPAPFYENCSYDSAYYALAASRVWAFSSLLNRMIESDPPQRLKTEPPEPLLPSRSVTPVLHEYDWREPVNTSAAFSIVDTSGTVYLATMVWVQGNVVHFNSVEGGVRHIPLSSIWMSLTQATNALNNQRLPSLWTRPS